MKKYFLILYLLITASIYANTQVDSLKIKTPKTRRYELEEYRVIATTPDEKIGSVDIKHLEDTSTIKDLNLTDLLKDISGLSITTGSKGESNLRIRGFQKENIKIMIDGRPLSGGYFGNVNLSEIPIFDISEVQVVKGAISTFYGNNATGGVVNFVSKKPSTENWLTLRTSIKRNNTQSLQLIAAHRYINWDYWLNISGYKTDGFTLSDDFKPTPYESGGVRKNSENTSVDIQSKINFSLFDIHSIGISLGYTFANERNVPSSIYEPLYRKFTNWKRYQFTTISAFQIGPWYNLQASIFYDAYDNTLQEFNDIQMTNLSLESILESWKFGSTIKGSYILSDKNTLHHIYRFEKDVYNRKDNQNYDKWTSNNTLLHNMSFFLSHKFNHHWNTNISGAFSKSQRNFNTLIDAHIDSGLTAETINTNTYFEPAISLNYEDNNFSTKNIFLIPHQLNAGLAFSQNIQYPTMHQLFSSSRGNPYLNPEKVYKIELNTKFVYLFNHYIANFETELFYNYLLDKIDRLNSSQYINQSKTKNAGFETRLINQFYNKFETSHSFSYINLKMNDDYDYYHIPKYTIFNSLSYNVMSNLKISYSINWSDKRLSPDDSGKLHNLSSYILNDIGLYYSKNQYKLSLSIQNIFDKDYQEEYGFPATGRNYSLSIEWVIF